MAIADQFRQNATDEATGTSSQCCPKDCSCHSTSRSQNHATGEHSRN
jgi:hypothetical protein